MRSLVLAALALAVVPAAAQAQDTDVGGKVPSVLELTLSDVSLGRLPANGDLTARVRVTSTINRTALSAVDEDLGRSPIEARVGSSVFQPLDLSIDPLLAVFRRPVANEGHDPPAPAPRRAGPVEHDRLDHRVPGWTLNRHLGVV